MGEGFGELMKKWFLFSLIWSVGGNLDTNWQQPPPSPIRTIFTGRPAHHEPVSPRSLSLSMP